MNTNKPEVAVFFHYFEADSTYCDNLIFFLARAYLPNVDFYIVIAGECSIDLPQKPNIHYFYVDNINLDYGGYCQAFERIENIDKYDACIFINSSMRGPFTVSYFQGEWTDIFTNHLKDDVHLVGATINLMIENLPSNEYLKEKYGYPFPHSHVQSTAYGLSRQALQHLFAMGFYGKKEHLEKDMTIALYELRLSQEMKRNGWNMKSFCAPYNTIDYRKPHGEINPTSFYGYMLFENSLFGRTASPMETVFMKTKTDTTSNTAEFEAKNLVISIASHTYTSLMTDTHPDMADWPEVAKLSKRAEIAMQTIHPPPFTPLLTPPVPPKSPFRVFGKIYRSLKKKITNSERQ